MNTRRALKQLFDEVGMVEESFQYLDDCRTFQRWKTSNFLELCLWKSSKRSSASLSRGLHIGDLPT